MKLLTTVTTLTLTLALCVGCNSDKKADESKKSESGSKQLAPPAGLKANPGAIMDPSPAAGLGKVLETMDAGGYTYVKLQKGQQEIWAAGPKTTVQVGDAVTIPDGMAMHDFHSKTLDRTFEVIYFVSAISAGATNPAEVGGMPMGHPKVAAPAAEPIEGIEKAEGGLTVAEIFAQKGELSGKPVVLRGKVVKYAAKIMGKNWLHIQDGSGAEGTNDLTVTTNATAAVGDTVVITGTVATDKDFGAGYKYAVIVEDASVTKE